MPRPDLIPSRGAVAEPLVMEVARELTHDDLRLLSAGPKVGVPVLQRIRATHHRQAALLAEGKSVTDVALIIGCTTARITQLQNDPAFAELIVYYRDQIMTAQISDAARLKDKIIDVGEMAVNELAERLEDDDRRRRMHVADVRKIAEFAMDRTVAPPQVAASTPAPPAAITINFGTPIRTPSELTGRGDLLEGRAEPSERAPERASERAPFTTVAPAVGPSVKPKRAEDE